MKMKKCTGCGEEKPATLEYFYKRTDTSLCSRCKLCRRAYYAANKESFAERNKAYREANKEAIAAYYEANKEAILEREKAYREANKEVILERKKAHYRTPKGRYVNIKARAKRDEIKFSLPFELYESQLWGKPCHYCGCEIEVTGLDRKNSDRGYTPDNVVPCCINCNSKKRTKPYEVFLEECLTEINK